MTTITQEMISSAQVTAINYIKPAPFAVALVDGINKELLTSKVSIFKADNGYDAIRLGTLDDVDYGSDYHDENGLLREGVGTTLAISADGTLDAYPNSTILNQSKFRKVGTEEMDENPSEVIQKLRSLNVSDALLDEVVFFTKLSLVPMVKVSEIKEALGISGSVSVQATWGLQNDIEDHDFIVLVEGDAYKVDMDSNTFLPEKYIAV